MRSEASQAPKRSEASDAGWYTKETKPGRQELAPWGLGVAPRNAKEGRGREPHRTGGRMPRRGEAWGALHRDAAPRDGGGRCPAVVITHGAHQSPAMQRVDRPTRSAPAHREYSYRGYSGGGRR